MTAVDMVLLAPIFYQLIKIDQDIYKCCLIFCSDGRGFGYYAFFIKSTHQQTDGRDRNPPRNHACIR